MPQPEAGNCRTGSCDRWSMESSCTRKSLTTKRPLFSGGTSVLHGWKGYVKCSTQIWMRLALGVGGAGRWVSCMHWSWRGKMVQMCSLETVNKWSIEGGSGGHLVQKVFMKWVHHEQQMRSALSSWLLKRKPSVMEVPFTVQHLPSHPWPCFD